MRSPSDGNAKRPLFLQQDKVSALPFPGRQPGSLEEHLIVIVSSKHQSNLLKPSTEIMGYDCEGSLHPMPSLDQ
jgi:hypothetical protein